MKSWILKWEIKFWMDCLFVVIIAIYILELVDDNHLEFLHRLKQKYCDKRRRYLMIYKL